MDKKATDKISRIITFSSTFHVKPDNQRYFIFPNGITFLTLPLFYIRYVKHRKPQSITNMQADK